MNTEFRPESTDLRLYTGRDLARKHDTSLIIRRIDHIEDSLDRQE